MAVNAKFIADFTQFDTAVQRAEVTLRDFSTGIGRVDRDLSRFGNQFSGVKLIQDARLMVESVERIGGTSRLTDGEMRRLTATVAEASDKMRRMGLEVPPAFGQIATETKRMEQAFAAMDASRPLVGVTESVGGASNAFGTFRSGLSQVDRTLAQFGVNLTPQVAALNEMSLAAGKTAAQLGLVASGALTVAAALGGWQLGRMVSGFFDLDEVIGNAAARLLGFGDVAAETAAAKLDVLARATKIAGYEIRVYADAVKIVNDEQKRLAESFNSPEQALARFRGEVSAAQREYRGLSASTREQIEQMLAWGRSASEVEKVLQLKSGTVQVLTERTKLKAEQDKQNTQVANERAAAEKRLAESVTQLTDAHDRAVSSLAQKLFGFDDIARAQQYIEAIGGVEHVSRLSATAQEDLARVMRSGVEAMLQAGAGTDAMTSKMEAFRLAATQSARDAEAAFRAIQAEAAATAALMQQASLTIIGQTPGAPVQSGGPGSLNQTGVTMFGGDAAVPMFKINPSGPGAGLPFAGGLYDLAQNRQSVTVNVSVDARESMYDTPEGVNRLADRVGEAVVRRVASRGGAVR